MGFLDRLSRGVNRWTEFAVFGLGATMAAVVAVQVFFRYVLNQSLFWSEELARFQLVWLTFLGAAVAYRRGAHPGIDALHARLPPAWRRATTVLVHGVSAALFAVMIVYGAQFAYFVRNQISPALGLPKWIVFAVIPVGGALLLVHAVAFLAAEVRGGRP